MIWLIIIIIILSLLVLQSWFRPRPVYQINVLPPRQRRSTGCLLPFILLSWASIGLIIGSIL